MPVVIPIRCIRRNPRSGEVISQKPTRLQLEFIHQPSNLPKDMQESIIADLMSSTKSAFRRPEVAPPEVKERTFDPKITLLVLVRQKNRAVGYYSIQTLHVRSSGDAVQNGILLRATVLHKKVKGFGLMGLMQSAALLLGSERFRLQGRAPHFVAAYTQKNKVAASVRSVLGSGIPDVWRAVVRQTHPNLLVTSADEQAGIVRGAFLKEGELYPAHATSRDPDLISGLNTRNGDAVLLVGRYGNRERAPTSHPINTPSLPVALARRVVGTFKQGLFHDAFEWSAPDTLVHFKDPEKQHISTLVMNALQKELTGQYGHHRVFLDPHDRHPELKEPE